MSSKVKDKDKVDLKDDLDEKLERHKLWANLILLRDGRTCFGSGVYTSEEEAWKACPYANEGRDRLADMHPLTDFCNYSKPNNKGVEVRFKLRDRVSKFPVPITQEE